MQHRIEAYILAGGRSSRMGRDKAMLELAGKTLLSRAVQTLKEVQSLVFNGCKPNVTIVGERALLEGADRVIVDRHPGCGPLGGMEAALSDLEATRGADWALFIPVDMPFLPPTLIETLLLEWIEASHAGARVCFAVVDGTPQPLLSLVHKSIHSYLLKALEEGAFKVTPVLYSACSGLASSQSGELGSSDRILRKTVVSPKTFVIRDSDRVSSAAAYRSRHLWFANLNTEEELAAAETFLMTAGSTHNQFECESLPPPDELSGNKEGS